MSARPVPSRPLLAADAILRGRGGDVSLPTLAGLLVGFGLLYGAAMGSFTGLWDGQPIQLLYSALKVPLLLVVSFAVALPSFFALNTILGLRDDLAAVVRGIVAAQAALTTVLASLAPLTLAFYAGSADYPSAILCNAAMFFAATLAGQVVLRRVYRPLIARDPKHRWMFWAWGVLYAFVGVQAAWVLRPFIGDPGRPVTFFRDGAWGNAYVEIFRIARAAFGI